MSFCSDTGECTLGTVVCNSKCARQSSVEECTRAVSGRRSNSITREMGSVVAPVAQLAYLMGGRQGGKSQLYTNGKHRTRLLRYADRGDERECECL